MLRHIIKYSNRRLYDATQRKVITLLELSDLLADGEHVSVVVKDTGEDITAVTVLQSVIERLKRRSGDDLGAGAAEQLRAVVSAAIERESLRPERFGSEAA